MLKQKSAIVTGSTSGIGLGVARGLAEQGADVLLNGFGNADEIEFTRAELQRQYGVKVRYSDADMSRPEQIRAMADLARAEFGITCNTICPGYVKTPLVDKQIADQAKAHNISPADVVRDVMLVHQARKEFVKV
jgi:NAD(P)-dependent dehydrogenase (short-subunit alcohol dehydrogenase family)